MSNGPAESYDPLDISIIVAGQDVQGLAPDSFVTVTRKNDMWELVEGCDGQVARAKSNSTTCEVKLTIMQTSPTNDVLSALYTADEKTGAGLFPIFIRDSSGTTTFFALQAWIPKPADISFGKSVGNREWTIQSGESTMFVGGES
jgi:Protein of unknown function (DUF3277)